MKKHQKNRAYLIVGLSLVVIVLLAVVLWVSSRMPLADKRMQFVTSVVMDYKDKVLQDYDITGTSGVRYTCAHDDLADNPLGDPIICFSSISYFVRSSPKLDVDTANKIASLTNDYFGSKGYLYRGVVIGSNGSTVVGGTSTERPRRLNNSEYESHCTVIYSEPASAREKDIDFEVPQENEQDILIHLTCGARTYRALYPVRELPDSPYGF